MSPSINGVVSKYRSMLVAGCQISHMESLTKVDASGADTTSNLCAASGRAGKR